MSSFSYLNGFARLLFPIIIFGLLINRTCSKSEVLQADFDEVDETVESISFCDENLIKTRESSKR